MSEPEPNRTEAHSSRCRGSSIEAPSRLGLPEGPRTREYGCPGVGSDYLGGPGFVGVLRPQAMTSDTEDVQNDSETFYRETTAKERPFAQGVVRLHSEGPGTRVPHGRVMDYEP